MASRQTPPSTGKQRRRPSPAMPGSWIWLVMLAMVVGMLVLNSFSNSGAISYSKFLKLVYDDKYSQNLSKLNFVGAERIQGEVKNTEDLPEDLRGPLSGKKFVTLRPPLEDPDLMERLRKLSLARTDSSLEITREEEHFGWLAPLLMMLLPATSQV